MSIALGGISHGLGPSPGSVLAQAPVMVVGRGGQLGRVEG